MKSKDCARLAIIGATIVCFGPFWAARAKDHSSQCLPILSVKDDPHGQSRTLVNIRVPSIDGLEMDLWCYENGPWGKAVATGKEGRDLILTHKKDGATIVTRFVPASDRIRIHVIVEGPSATAVQGVESLNPCWQFVPSLTFGNQGDYVEDFVARCFVFLDRGMTYLKDTRRIPGTRERKNDRDNLPNPWIQEYYPVWRRHPGQTPGARGRSPDRPVYPITGVVSRDKRHMAAMAWPETGSIGQVWHDCLHLRPRIVESYDKETQRTESLGVIYFLLNDPALLLQRFKEDFPDWNPSTGQEDS